MATLAILDFGFGGALALENALLATGAEVVRLEHGLTAHAYDALVLTGYGRFGEAMRSLEGAGMFSALWNFFEEVRKPILGISLGMHMLASGSEESPGQPGLNILPGTARSMPSRLGKPYTGWHRMELDLDDPLFEGIDPLVEWHFMQDYMILSTTLKKALAGEYILGGLPTAGALRRGSVWGLQFDPVKSGEAGQQLLINFVALVDSLIPATSSGEG